MEKTSSFIDPKKIVSQIGLEKNSVVADFGCGSGYFTIPIAEMLGEEGMVYALDVLSSALESIESQKKIRGLSNITTKRVNLEKEGGSKLENESIDCVVMKDMLFQNKGKEIIIKEAMRVLKSGGKALVVEWDEKEASFGPEKILKVEKDNLKNLITQAGFKIDKEINDAGDYHYGFVAVK